MGTCQYRPSSRWFRCRGTTTDWDLGLPRKRQKRANAMRMGSIRPPVREILWAPKTIFGRPGARQNDCSAPFPPTSSQVLRLHPAESAKILVEKVRQGKQALGRCAVGGAHASPVSALLTMRICHALPLRIDFGLLELFGISYFTSVQRRPIFGWVCFTQFAQNRERHFLGFFAFFTGGSDARWAALFAAAAGD